MLSGIKQSTIKADKILSGQLKISINNANYQGHLRACIALYNLILSKKLSCSCRVLQK